MDFQKYSKPSQKYPTKADYTQVFVYSQGKVIGEYSSPEYTKLKSTFPDSHVAEKVVDIDGFKQAQRNYNLELKKLKELFWEDAFDELGIDLNHPKVEKLKELAWDYGHSEGFSNVFYHLSNISELITE